MDTRDGLQAEGGSGEPRASDQPHHRRLVQWGERSVFWYERRHHGKDKANGQEQRGAGRGGREVLQKPEKEGSEEARKTRGIERGLTPSRPSQPQFQRGSRAATVWKLSGS